MAKKRPVSQDEAFLRDIIDHADDDAPRLVYADWLEDHGQAERAEFIRLQCEHARLDEDDPRREVLTQREQELLSAHGAGWRDNLLPGSTREGRCWFRRGFVAEVAMTASDFLEHGAELCQSTPLDGLRLLVATGRMEEVAVCPWLRGLRRLDLSHTEHRLGPEDIRALAGSPHLSNLQSLDLTFQRIGNAGLQAIANSPNLGSLRALYLEFNFMLLAEEPTGREFLDLGPLLRSRHRDSLTTLYVSGNRLAPDSVAAIAAFPRLAALTLDGGEPAQMKRFARSPTLASLRVLSIFTGPGRVETVRALAGSLHLGGLVALELRHCGFTDASAKALASSPHLANLRHLGLWANYFRDAGAEAFANSPHLGGLTALDLGCNKIGQPGAEVLAASSHLKNLRQLELRGNVIRSEGAAAIRARFGKGASCDYDQEGHPIRSGGKTLSEQWPRRRQEDLRGIGA
jgi:uncharacterized protein (TIGR02996 family)